MGFRCYGKLNENEAGLDEKLFLENENDQCRMKCDFIQNYYVFNCLQKQLQNHQSFKTQREYGKKTSLRKLLRFSIYPLSLQICTNF